MSDLTLIIFCITYLGLAVGSLPGLRLDRTGIAFVGGVAMLVSGAIPLGKAVAAVNFQAILLLFALMVIASQLHYAGFYGKIADVIGRTLRRPAVFLALLIGASGLLSGMLSNSVVGFAFTPVVVISLKKRGLNPVPFLVAMIMACNIGGGLTTIGNAQNVVLAQMAGIDFAGYLGFSAIPVALSLAATWLVVWRLGRDRFHLPVVHPDPGTEVLPDSGDHPFNWWRTVKGVGAILAVTVCFFTPLPHYLVALAAAALLLCSRRLGSKQVLAGVDMQILLLFISLFVLVGAFVGQGWDRALAEWLEHRSIDIDSPVPLAVAGGVLSNLISNAAAVLLLTGIIDFAARPELGMVLALSSSMAGNFLLIGSMTALIVTQTAATSGVVIGLREFMRYSVPTALVSFVVLIAWIL